MPCACNANKDNGGKNNSNTTTVQSPSGKKTSFKSRADAELYAARVGGKII